MQLSSIIEKIKGNARIDADEALFLLNEADLLLMAHLADVVRRTHHPEPVVTYVSDRNINYTNICISGCRFCAYFRPPGHEGGYVLERAQLDAKIEETLSVGGTQILLQGGLNPALDLDYYLDLLRHIKSRFNIHIHGFSPPEMVFISKKAGGSVQEVLEKMKSAGLVTIPGGGAEILVDDIRRQVSPNKCSAWEWLEVMRTAHGLGIRTTATMMFGHIEESRHIIQHLLRIRALQDETGGFTAFIPWTFQPAHTRIHVSPKTAAEYLRILALSRLVLDNFDNVQASWVTQGDKIAQLALAFGANDLGSTMIEENVVAAAGVHFRLPQAEIVRLIEDAGYTAQQRDCYYHAIPSGRRAAHS